METLKERQEGNREGKAENKQRITKRKERQGKKLGE